MQQRILRSIAVLIASFAIVMGVALPVAADYDPFGPACNSAAADSAVCSDHGDGSTNPLTGQNGLFRGISGVLAFVTGLSVVVIVVVSGLRYATAAGDANKAKSARQAIVAALIGMVIIIFADMFISLILSRL